MKVLLITPYSPLLSHSHAAEDLAVGLVSSLRDHVDLHVYSPGSQLNRVRDVSGVTFHSGSEEASATPSRVDGYPRALRMDWPKGATRDVKNLVLRLQPDLVHGEYLQAYEGLAAVPGVARSLTIHDVHTRGNETPDRLSYFLPRDRYRRWQRTLERQTETRALLLPDHVFALSQSDTELVRQLNPRASTLNIGVDIPRTRWACENKQRPPRLLFAGALWREPNQRTAQFLATQVLPLIRTKRPDARLRIVGSGAPATVEALGEHPGVDFVGAVPDFDVEFLKSSLVFSPSLVEAGVLLKALRAMACGAPTILNGLSATPLAARNYHHALIAETAQEFAEAALRILQDDVLAEHIGGGGRALVAANYSWYSFARAMVTGFSSAAEHFSSK